MKNIVAILMCTSLFACSQADEPLQTATQVAPWAQQVMLNAEQQVITAPRDVALFNAQLPHNPQNVFVPMTTLTAKPAPIVVGKLELLPMIDEPTVIVAPPLPPQKNINLSQAAASELKYVGLLSHDGQTVGMVQVLEHLYPVHVGDTIGQGKWQVLSLNAQTMQIKIAQKAVVYEKN